MSDNIRQKDPDALREFPLNYSEWLASLGEGKTIVGSAWTVPTGITEEESDFTDLATSIWLSGGTHGVDYELLNHVTLSDDQEDEFALIVQVRDVEADLSILIATVGGSTSNSYVTLTEAKTYFLRRLYTDAWDNASDEEQENALLAATMQLDQLDYVGSPVTTFQALKWPREAHPLIKLTDGQQLITKAGTVTGGNFTIIYGDQTTLALDHDASRATIQNALEAILGQGNVFVEGGPISASPIRIIFQGSLSEIDVSQVTVNSTLLTGGGTYVPSTSIAGGQALIPKAIKEATYELAIRILSAVAAGLTGVASGSEGLSEVDLGPIKLKYDGSDSSASNLSVGTLSVDSQGIPIDVSRILKGIRLWPLVA